jgi:hypothetical protein
MDTPIVNKTKPPATLNAAMLIPNKWRIASPDTIPTAKTTKNDSAVSRAIAFFSSTVFG